MNLKKNIPYKSKICTANIPYISYISKKCFKCMTPYNSKNCTVTNRRFVSDIPNIPTGCKVTNLRFVSKACLVRDSKTFNWLLFDSYYRDIISQDLIYKQNYQNVMELPKIDKLVVNSTSKLFTEDRKNITPTIFGLEIICGQKYKYSVAKKSIAGFKIRESQIIGCKVTLRKHFISYFLDKYRLVILPRYGNFMGCNMKSFDKDGNYTIGLNDLLLFPELEAQFELFENLAGIDLSFVMCKKKQPGNLLLLSALQIPVQKK